jgi:hypothetical protein
MQPGAFLQLLLILAAIASRSAVIVSELTESLEAVCKIVNAISNLLLDASVSPLPPKTSVSAPEVASTPISGTAPPEPPNEMAVLPSPQGSVLGIDLDLLVTWLSPARNMVARKIIRPDKSNPDESGKKAMRNEDFHAKTKRKRRTDEIDDIFGF